MSKSRYPLEISILVEENPDKKSNHTYGTIFSIKSNKELTNSELFEELDTILYSICHYAEKLTKEKKDVPKTNHLTRVK